MTDIQKKKWLDETYRAFLSDLEHLDKEKLELMKRVVHRIEEKKTEEVRTLLN